MPDVGLIVNAMLWIAMVAIVAYLIVLWPFRNDLDPNLSIPKGLKKLEEQGVTRAKYARLLFVGGCYTGVVAGVIVSYLKM